MEPQYGVQPQVVNRKNFPRDDQHRTGRLQIIYGILCVLLGIGLLVTKAGGGKFGLINTACPGIWGGVLSIIAGVVGIISCADEKTATIAVTALLSVLSLFASALFTLFSVIACMADRNLLKKDPVTGFIKTMVVIDPESKEGEIRLRLILDILAICVGICAMFIALIQFVISAFACCNGGKEDEQQGMVVSSFGGPDNQAAQSYPFQQQQQQLYPHQQGEVYKRGITPHYL